jgi:hypothetical protein
VVKTAGPFDPEESYQDLADHNGDLFAEGEVPR